MSREIFEKRYGKGWSELEATLVQLEKKGGGARLDQDGPRLTALFPELYRQVCHQLALARHRHYGADLERRLNLLALQGHQQLYRSRAGELESAVSFAVSGFPALVRAEKRLVLLALLLLFGPALAIAAAVTVRPEVAFSLLPAEVVEGMVKQYAPGGSLQEGRAASSDLVMFGFYIYNNIGIAFRSFASGIFFGVGSIFFLVYNGLFMGAIGGFLHEAGYEATFYPFVIGHGAFELPAIALSSAAGLRIGLSLLSPGRRTRARALVESAREIVPMLYGSAVMLVIAAFLEAFWSSSSLISPRVKLALGGVLWLVVPAYFLLAGRRRGS